MNGYDIIGDVHGYASLLKALFKQLNYSATGNSYFHPLGRKIVFVGDLINRGPDSIKVLNLIRKMHSQKQAFCVLGNHEFRLIQNFVKNPSSIDPSLVEFIPWIRSLPLFLEFPKFRVVHAAWHFSSIKKLKSQSVEDDNFILSTMLPDSVFKRPVQIILQGIHITLPQDWSYSDRFGITREKARMRWWEKDRNCINGSNFFPKSEKYSNSFFKNNCELGIEYYSKSEKPVFVGHYCLPPNEPKINDNVICVDGCVSCDKVLWAYRYNNDRVIDEKGLISTT